MFSIERRKKRSTKSIKIHNCIAYNAIESNEQKAENMPTYNACAHLMYLFKSFYLQTNISNFPFLGFLFKHTRNALFHHHHRHRYGGELPRV